MVVHKKNLLDAFRQAAPEGRRAPEQETRSAKAGGAGGPFAHAQRSASEPRRVEEPRDGSSEHEPAGKVDEKADPTFESAPALESAEDRRPGLARLVADPGFRLIVLVAVLIGAGAYLANRFGSKHVQAAESASSPRGETAGAGVLAGGAAGQDALEKNRAAARMGTPTDQAFMNLENKFTVQLAQYNDDEAGRKKAFETADFLRKLAIPVVGPISKGKSVILAAGAKPRTEELASLLKTIQAQHGTGGQEKQLPFASAYIQNIDALVQRR
jgi:hypothetical protein